MPSIVNVAGSLGTLGFEHLFGFSQERGLIKAHNLAAPDVWPTVQQCIFLRNAGMISDHDFSVIMRWNGINVDSSVWQKLVEGTLQWPDKNEALRWIARGYASGEKSQKLLAMCGLGRQDNYDMWRLKPFDWQPEEIRKLYLLDKWGKGNDVEKWQDYRAALDGFGLRQKEDRDRFEQLYNPVPFVEAREMLNRGLIDEKLFLEQAYLAGHVKKEVIDAIEQMRFDIPSATDIEEMAIKEVWNRQVVERFGYDDEFDQIPEFRIWLEKAGLGGNPAISEQQFRDFGAKVGATQNEINKWIEDSKGQPDSWAKAWWRKHWRNVSPTQAFTMLHRCRGDKNDPSTWRIHGVRPFNMDDVNGVLKVNDYPPYFRSQLAAISFLPLRLVDIRNMVYFSLGSKAFKDRAIGQNTQVIEWAKEQFLDRGQNPTNASYLAEMAIEAGNKRVKFDREKRYRNLFKGINSNTYKRYQIGLIDRPEAVKRLAETGLPLDEISTHLDAIDLEERAADVKFAIGLLRSWFLKGEVGIEDVEEELKLLRLTPTAIARYVNRFSLLLDEERKTQLTEKILNRVAHGLMPVNVAIARLSRIGWSNVQEIMDAIEWRREMALIPPS
jgi:hypothetical protein